MRDSLSFDTVPIEEEVESLGPDYDTVRARKQANRLISLLKEKFPNPPPNAHLGIKSNPHDFGSYLSVECYFDDEDENRDSLDYCLSIESNFPMTWNDTTPIKWNKKKTINREREYYMADEIKDIRFGTRDEEEDSERDV